MTTNDDARLRAIIADSSRPDPLRDAARAADVQYAPRAWTEAEEAELVEKLHGTEAERLDALIAELNESRRRS